MGICTLNSLPNKGDGICVIRSHGESFDVFNKVNEIGFELVDLTCFDVKKVQNKAMELAKNGYFIWAGIPRPLQILSTSTSIS